MSTLTIRLPDDTVERLKALARSRGLSMNKLVEGNRSHPYAEEAFGMGGRGGASVPFRAASITDLR